MPIEPPKDFFFKTKSLMKKISVIKGVWGKFVWKLFISYYKDFKNILSLKLA